MSEFRDVQFAIVDDRIIGSSDPVQNLRTGLTFSAEIEEIQDTILNTELGIDPRATTIFNVRDKTVDIVSGDKLSAIGQTFMVLPRAAPDSPTRAQLKIYAMLLISKDS